MTTRLLTGAAFLALTAGAAGADVTARQVWDDWVAALDGTDAQLSTGSIDESNGTVTVTDVEMTSEAETGSYSVAVDRLTLDTNPDGTVSVTMSPSYPITLEGRDEQGQPTSVTLEVTHPDLVLTVSGDEENRNHAYRAPQISIELVEATRDGAPMEAAFAATLTDTAGSYAVADDDLRRFDSNITAGGLDLTAAGTDPATGEAFAIAVTMQDLSADNITSFLDADMSDMAASLRDGFATESALRYGPSTYRVSGTGEDGRFTAEGSAESGELAVDVSADGLTYGGRNAGSVLTLSGDQIPVPEVTVEFAESEALLRMPLLAGEGGQPFGLVVRLVDLSLGDEIWSMIDPTGTLPREPATLILDVAGSVDLQEDMMKQEMQEGPMTAPPGELESLTVRELELSAAGAELSGAGQLEFQPGPANMPPGMPQPVGQIELRLEGANALIDRLVEIGALPQEQAMSARMMLGLFARPGDGEDTLTSTIQFTEDGQIVANGQRLR